jgi:ribosomal protein S18 acetylase RimI-like enzyme
VRVVTLDHRDLAIATAIHAVQKLAYTQEAALLEVNDFPPLKRTPADIQASGETYLGALLSEEIVGSLSLSHGEEPGHITIASLVVHPSHQRQGIARLLVTEALQRSEGHVVTVSTGAKNLPAVRLYQDLGFVEYARCTVGPEELELVKLRRARAR